MTKWGIHQEFKTGLTSENQCNSPQQQKKKEKNHIIILIDTENAFDQNLSFIHD